MKGLLEEEEKVVEEDFVVFGRGDLFKMMMTGVSQEYGGGMLLIFGGWDV